MPSAAFSPLHFGAFHRKQGEKTIKTAPVSKVLFFPFYKGPILGQKTLFFLLKTNLLRSNKCESSASGPFPGLKHRKNYQNTSNKSIEKHFFSTKKFRKIFIFFKIFKNPKFFLKTQNFCPKYENIGLLIQNKSITS